MDLAQFLPLLHQLIPAEVYGRDDTIFQERPLGTCVWTCPIMRGNRMGGVLYLTVTAHAWRVYVAASDGSTGNHSEGVLTPGWMGEVQRCLRTILVPKPLPPVSNVRLAKVRIDQ